MSALVVIGLIVLPLAALVWSMLHSAKRRESNAVPGVAQHGVGGGWNWNNVGIPQPSNMRFSTPLTFNPASEALEEVVDGIGFVYQIDHAAWPRYAYEKRVPFVPWGP